MPISGTKQVVSARDRGETTRGIRDGDEGAGDCGRDGGAAGMDGEANCKFPEPARTDCRRGETRGRFQVRDLNAGAVGRGP